jgi:hypothetical protein
LRRDRSRPALADLAHRATVAARHGWNVMAAYEDEVFLDRKVAMSDPGWSD